MIPSASSLIAVGIDILSTIKDAVTGSLLAQLGSVANETTTSEGAEIWQHAGFASRPSNAQAKQAAAQGVTVRRGDTDIVIAERDLRGQAISGNLGPGETCLYAAGKDGNSQARVIAKDDGSISLFTTHDNTPTGTSVCLQLAPDRLAFVAPWGSIMFDKSGFHLKTGPTEAPTTRLDMGGIAVPGLPEPFASAIGAYAQIVAPVITLNGSPVQLGPGPYVPAVGNAASPLVVGPTTPGVNASSVRVTVP